MMSSSAVGWTLTVIYCSFVAYCNAHGDYVTAYVKEYLASTTCETVPQISTVCNIHWKLRDTDAELYDDLIEAINATISSSEIYRGLSDGDAMHCRKMYENMQCRNTFPACDWERKLVDHGDAKKRCEFAKQACTTISIEGCEFSSSGVEPIILEKNKCEPIAANTSKLCPGDTQLKVPKQYKAVAKLMVGLLSTTAETFAEEIKNHTNMERCEMKYREVLCRLIDTCSPDELYYLHYINIEECEEMISCVKSAGFSHDITSVCSEIPNTEDEPNVTVRNPYPREELPPLTTTETQTTTTTTTATTTTTTTTTMKPDHSTKKMSISTEDVSKPTTPRETVPTHETLIEPSKRTTKSDKKNTQASHGRGSGNRKNVPLFTMAVTMFLGLAAHQLP